MGEPDIASNPSEFQKIATAASEIEPVAEAYSQIQQYTQELTDAKSMLKEAAGVPSFMCGLYVHAGADFTTGAAPVSEASLEWKTLSLKTGDEELAEMARDEVDTLNKRLADLETQAKVLLLPKDPLDDKNIMLEVAAFPPIT